MLCYTLRCQDVRNSHPCVFVIFISVFVSRLLFSKGLFEGLDWELSVVWGLELSMRLYWLSLCLGAVNEFWKFDSSQWRRKMFILIREMFTYVYVMFEYCTWYRQRRELDCCAPLIMEQQRAASFSKYLSGHTASVEFLQWVIHQLEKCAPAFEGDCCHTRNHIMGCHYESVIKAFVFGYRSLENICRMISQVVLKFMQILPEEDFLHFGV